MIKTVIAELFKLLVGIVMICIAALAICVIFGEEAPGVHLNFVEFFGCKIAAGLVLYLEYKFFLFHGRHGLLPIISEDSYRELISEEDECA